MKKSLFLIASLSVMFVACDNNGTDKRVVAPDNTARNAEHQLTATDQLENEADRTVSQKIREAIVADNGLSTDAKNIKIITINGVVTLRGVVKNENEKTAIFNKAKAVTGVRNVDNQLDIVRE